MSDYSEHGAIPVEDAAVDDPPTEAEVIEAQKEHFPEQAATATYQLDREPDAGQLPSDTDVQAERQAEGVAAEREHDGE